MFNELNKIFLNSLDGALSTQQVLLNNENFLSKKGIILNSEEKTIVNSKTGEEIKFLDSGYSYKNQFCEIINSGQDNLSIVLKESSEKSPALNIFKIKENILAIQKYMKFYEEIKNIQYPDNMKDMLLCWQSFYTNNSLYQENFEDKREYCSQTRILDVLISNFSSSREDMIINSYNNFFKTTGREDVYLTFVEDFQLVKMGNVSHSLNKATTDVVFFLNDEVDSNKYFVLLKPITEKIPELESFILNEFDKIKVMKNVFSLLVDYYKKNPTYNSVNIEEIELSLLGEDISEYKDLYNIIETVKLKGDKKCLNNYKK